MKVIPARRTLAAFSVVALFLLAGCADKAASTKPLEIGTGTVCALDDMALKDFPGPKAQIHYEQGEPEFYCDTRELLSVLLRPEQKKRVIAAYTQDMARADWTRPEGHWIDAKTAFYVLGSSRKGSMGPTLASFASEKDAAAFAAQYGGKVHGFAAITAEMVDLSGGAKHDHRM